MGFVVNPMTLIVLVVLTVGFTVGVLMIRRANRHTQPEPAAPVCRRCQKVNSADARYCANCGLPLK